MNERRILIFEDEPIISISLEETLQGKGWSTRVAPTPTGAMEEFRGFEPDVVLMDINLEVEYDGIAIAQSIRDESDTPIIFLTGHSDPETFEKARQTIPYGFISKPVQNHQLCHTVELALTQVQERKKSKPALLATASALTKLQYAVFTVDLNGEIVSWNEVALEALGGHAPVKGAALGQTLHASAGDEVALVTAIGKAAQNGDSSDLTKNLASLKATWEYVMVSPLNQPKNEGVMVLLRKRSKEETSKVAADQSTDPLTGLLCFQEENLNRIPEGATCVLFHAQNYIRIASRLGRHVADQVMLSFTMNITKFFEGVSKTLDCHSCLFRARGPVLAAIVDADELSLQQLRRAIDQFMSSRRKSVVDLVSQPGTLVSISANHLILPASLRQGWIEEANLLNEKRTV